MTAKKRAKANGIGTALDFRRAVEAKSVERVALPASGITVLLCRPPIFAALVMGRKGSELQRKVLDVKPEEVRSEDTDAFTKWLCESLTSLFVRP